MSNIYQPRLEVTNDHTTKSAWQDWGIFTCKAEAMVKARNIRKNIKKGIYNDRLSDNERKQGYYLNACVEVIEPKSFSLVEILDI